VLPERKNKGILMVSGGRAKTKVILLKILAVMQNFGLDPLRTINSIKALPGYLADLGKFKSHPPKELGDVFLHPCLSDRFDKSGTASGQYFHQDLLVAQKIFANQPQKHVDIGSRIDGFVAHVASFREIEIFDVRPNNVSLKNVKFFQSDMMEPIPTQWRSYSDSVSCLHALEHFGLGRYGDAIDHDGFEKGMENLLQICKPNGRVYLSLPIGPQRVEFNAHRVFSTSFLWEKIEKTYEIISFSFVDDFGNLHSEIKPDKNNIANNFHCHFGLGIFELRKL
jgi:SAM-dependent methyltransferase